MDPGKKVRPDPSFAFMNLVSFLFYLVYLLLNNIVIIHSIEATHFRNWSQLDDALVRGNQQWRDSVELMCRVLSFPDSFLLMPVQ